MNALYLWGHEPQIHKLDVILTIIFMLNSFYSALCKLWSGDVFWQVYQTRRFTSAVCEDLYIGMGSITILDMSEKGHIVYE